MHTLQDLFKLFEPYTKQKTILSMEGKSVLGQKLILEDEEMQLDKWNNYIRILDNIRRACDELDMHPVARVRAHYVSLNTGIRRSETATHITFTVKPVIDINDELYLMHNMTGYPLTRLDPEIFIPPLSVTFSREWLRTRAINMVMERMVGISIPQG